MNLAEDDALKLYNCPIAKMSNLPLIVIWDTKRLLRGQICNPGTIFGRKRMTPKAERSKSLPQLIATQKKTSPPILKRNQNSNALLQTCINQIKFNTRLKEPTEIQLKPINQVLALPNGACEHDRRQTYKGTVWCFRMGR